MDDILNESRPPRRLARHPRSRDRRATTPCFPTTTNLRGRCRGSRTATLPEGFSMRILERPTLYFPVQLACADTLPGKSVLSTAVANGCRRLGKPLTTGRCGLTRCWIRGSSTHCSTTSAPMISIWRISSWMANRQPWRWCNAVDRFAGRSFSQAKRPSVRSWSTGNEYLSSTPSMHLFVISRVWCCNSNSRFSIRNTRRCPWMEDKANSFYTRRRWA